MIEGITKSRTLFDSIPDPVVNKVAPEKRLEPEIEKEPITYKPTETIAAPPVTGKKEPENELYNTFFGAEKPIERMIVFFKDQTFKVYNPSPIRFLNYICRQINFG